MKNWIFNEFKHCGVDYSDLETALHYDDEHQKFRNFDKEVKDLLLALSLENAGEMSLVDIGCGTGAFSISASRYFKKIYAADVSEAMLECARKKAAERNVSNIEFVNSGFLTYEHAAEPADMVFTKAAMHHLPDFWKQIAMFNINKMLKMDGILYIFDIVFNFSPLEYEAKVEKWISGFEKITGKGFRKEIETHIRDEFSTFNWIIEEMLNKAGFRIEKLVSPDGMQTEYFCRKCKELTE